LYYIKLFQSFKGRFDSPFLTLFSFLARNRLQNYCFFLNWQNIFVKKCKKNATPYIY